MQKMREKLNANAVGASIARPHFIGMTLKKQEGITLIALIITIIVMLILVGVTINVALNGGLFEKADDATKLTQEAADKEELLSAVVAAIGNDGKVDFSVLDANLPTEEWAGTNGTYTSPKENIYTVDKNGKIEEYNPETNSMLGFYGDKEYAAIEFTTNTEGIFYELGTSVPITYDSTHLYVEGNPINYEVVYIKDSSSDEIINKIVIAAQYFMTSNSDEGIDGTSLDGNSYIGTGENTNITIKFEDGGCYRIDSKDSSNNNSWPYLFYNNKVYEKNAECSFEVVNENYFENGKLYMYDKEFVKVQ